MPSSDHGELRVVEVLGVRARLAQGTQAMSTYSGIEICIVEPGTRISDTRDGKTEVVTETNFVVAGRYAYCTKPMFDKLMAELDKRGVR